VLGGGPKGLAGLCDSLGVVGKQCQYGALAPPKRCGSFWVARPTWAFWAATCRPAQRPEAAPGAVTASSVRRLDGPPNRTGQWPVSLCLQLDRYDQGPNSKLLTHSAQCLMPWFGSGRAAARDLVAPHRVPKRGRAGLCRGRSRRRYSDALPRSGAKDQKGCVFAKIGVGRSGMAPWRRYETANPASSGSLSLSCSVGVLSAADRVAAGVVTESAPALAIARGSGTILAAEPRAGGASAAHGARHCRRAARADPKCCPQESSGWRVNASKRP
jgi:hypothetical protein